jgi:hypothetical protein
VSLVAFVRGVRNPRRSAKYLDAYFWRSCRPSVAVRSRDLTVAETTELQGQVNLPEAVITPDQAMGRTLEACNITISDTKTAHVTPIPNIPGTANRENRRND